MNFIISARYQLHINHYVFCFGFGGPRSEILMDILILGDETG